MTDEKVVESLISRNDPVDAVAAYYAWSHEGTRAHVCRVGEERGVYLEAESEWGPVGVVRATSRSVVPAVADAIPTGRQYVMAPWILAGALKAAVSVEDVERNSVYWLDRPIASHATVGTAVIRQQGAVVVADVEGEMAAKCWTLWRSPGFAELGVATKERFRRHGLARAVLSTMIANLLEQGVTPLYVVTVTNPASIHLVESLGFKKCEADEFGGYVVKK